MYDDVKSELRGGRGNRAIRGVVVIYVHVLVERYGPGVQLGEELQPG